MLKSSDETNPSFDEDHDASSLSVRAIQNEELQTQRLRDANKNSVSFHIADDGNGAAGTIRRR